MIIIGIIFGLLLIILQLPSVKGFLGELSIRLRLKTLLKKDHGYLLHNFLFLNEFQKTVEIDLLLISTKGLFVLEVKNYSGTIYGKEHDDKWVQSLNYGKSVHQFYNPIKQNNNHVYYLKKLLDTFTPNVFNKINAYVVFVQNNVKNLNLTNVLNKKDLIKTLKSYDNNVLSQFDVDLLYNTLQSYKLGKEYKQKHIEEVQETMNNIDNNICPRCHAPLVLRQGKYGRFYGCSNYPNCRFTKKEEK